MNSHYATRTVKDNGEWEQLTECYNISADISSTGGQMARGFGLAYASKKFKQLQVEDPRFSNRGDEVCFVTIGDASTSEGIFWEVLNAAVVDQVPMAVSVWDDGYGISVPKELQTAKASISKAISGLLKDDQEAGMLIYVGKAYDYPGLIEMYESGIERVRSEHVPALFHIEDCTQPQGHSTSGSHERYKSPERLQWEQDIDCIDRMAEWMVSAGIADQQKIDEMRTQAKSFVREAKDRAWKACHERSVTAGKQLTQYLDACRQLDGMHIIQDEVSHEMKTLVNAPLSEVIALSRRVYHQLVLHGHELAIEIKEWLNTFFEQARQDYHTHLYSQTPLAAIDAAIEPPEFSDDSLVTTGYQVLNTLFDKKMEENPLLIAFGEDVGKIGDVNQGFAGLQSKYGIERVFDTGIREWSIMGQAIGTAMRGLRPIAEIQYLDYLIFGLEPLTDDLATLRYRSVGQQSAPAIIRTRGHRLEGIWHAGSHLGMIVSTLRGMHVCVPRNMVQAAGMYNTLLKSDDPAIVIEPLNGYRLKERMPDNVGTFGIPLGLPEILSEGDDITLVTYGSCVRVAEKALELLEPFDIAVELIDVQTLLPFDLESIVVNSLKKTK